MSPPFSQVYGQNKPKRHQSLWSTSREHPLLSKKVSSSTSRITSQCVLSSPWATVQALIISRLGLWTPSQSISSPPALSHLQHWDLHPYFPSTNCKLPESPLYCKTMANFLSMAPKVLYSLWPQFTFHNNLSLSSAPPRPHQPAVPPYSWLPELVSPLMLSIHLECPLPHPCPMTPNQDSPLGKTCSSFRAQPERDLISPRPGWDCQDTLCPPTVPMINNKHKSILTARMWQTLS